MVNFLDTLNKNMNTIERPPLLPIGTYRAVVSKVPSTDTIANGDYDVVDFMMQMVEPAADDVDPADLAAYGGCGKHAVVRHRFMFNTKDQAMFDRTLFNVKRFLTETLKIDEGLSLKEALNASVNSQCLVVVKWRADKNDPETMFAEIARTAPIE